MQVRPAGPRIVPMTLRLATFNILHGRSLSDGEVDIPRFGRAVAALDADVLAMQEVDRDQPRSTNADLTAVAAKAIHAPHHRFAATLRGEPGVWTAATGVGQPGAAEYGIAIVSRHPVLRWRRLALPAMPIRWPLMLKDRPPILVRDEPRAALAATIDVPGGPLTIVSTHLTFLPGWNAIQLRRLWWACHHLPRPLVVMGDLNLRGRLPSLCTGWRVLAEGPTFPLEEPRHQIDHILGSGAVRTAGRGGAVHTGMSDHRALAVDVACGGCP
jgi:endonuclease/exonuclease/phosphatase family metal-dependent hydrolase